MDSTKQYEYFAFISYKREDEKWAKWLQHKLEYYKLPSSVRKDNPSLPEKIRPVFKDTTDLEPGVLAQKIQDALNSSKFLIVICSPRSANSVWVSKEVKSFIDSERADHIIPFIIGGTPNASNPDEECFPDGLRQLAGEQELLGANINEMGRDAAAIKVVARMFNLRFDTLWQRYRKEKNRQTFIRFIIFIFLFITGVIALSINHARRIEMSNSISTEALYLSLNGDRYGGIRKLSELLNKKLPITALTESNIQRVYSSPKSISLTRIPINSKDPHIAINPLYKIFAYGDEEGIVHLYNLENGYMTRQREVVNSKILDIGYFNNGNLLVASQWELKLLDGKSLETLDSVKVNIDPFGAILATDKEHFLLNEDSLSIYKINNGRIDLQNKLKTQVWTKSFDLSMTLGIIITGASDHRIRVWNVKTKELEWISPELHEDFVSAIKIDENNARIISAGKDGKVIIWDLESKKEIFQPFGHNSDGNTGGIYSIKYLPDKQLLFTASSDMTIGVWNTNNGYREGLPLHGHATTIDDIDYGHGYIVSAAQNSEIRIWDYDISSYKILDCESSNFKLLKTSNKNQLFIHSTEGIRLVNLNGDQIKKIANIVDEFILSFDIRTSSRFIIHNDFAKKMFKIIHLKDGYNHVDTITFEAADIDINPTNSDVIIVSKSIIGNFDVNTKSLKDSLSNDSKYNHILSTGNNNFVVMNNDSIAIGNFKKNRILRAVPHRFNKFSHITSKYTNRIAIGYDDGHISILDVNNLNNISYMKAHSGPISYLEFNSDGSKLISLSSRKAIGTNQSNHIRIWDVDSGSLYFEYQIKNITFQSVIFDDENSRLIGSANNGKVYFIPFPSLDDLIYNIKNFSDCDR